MGHVNTQIAIKNVRDIFNAEDGIIQEPEIRKATIDVMVDTGATTLVINEQLFEQLGLRSMGEREISLANEAKETCKVTEPLMINWEDRSVTMPALVIKDASEFLLSMAVPSRKVFPIFIQKLEIILTRKNYWNFPLAAGKKYYNVQGSNRGA
jgi:predicted aspartyl protease